MRGRTIRRLRHTRWAMTLVDVIGVIIMGFCMYLLSLL